MKEVALQQRFMDMTSGVHWTHWIAFEEQDLASLTSAYHIYLTSEESEASSSRTIVQELVGLNSELHAVIFIKEDA